MTAITTATIALAPSAHAYVDTDFANELHSYGAIYRTSANEYLCVPGSHSPATALTARSLSP
jgi:hypothetical protein